MRDRETRIFAHPDKVHEIGHKGKYFDVPGYHLCGAVAAAYARALSGRRIGPGQGSFAARHAECVFVAAPTKAALEGLC